MMIYPVPAAFQIPDRLHYPSDNFPDFEYWFMQNITEAELMYGDRVYLPILFTAFFKREQFGKNQAAIDILQRFVDTLPADKKYFCIVQYDDGVLINWKGKDVVVFGMSGKPKSCIPIPLICQPHAHKISEVNKDILISFVGRVTHPIRQTILDWGKEKIDCYVTSKHHSMDEYCKILTRSRFVICARGYGAGSFRICEAIQYGAMPVIIKYFDDNVYHCPFSVVYEYAHLFSYKDLDIIYEYISDGKISFVGMWDAYQKHYTFAGVKKIIFDSLWNLL